VWIPGTGSADAGSHRWLDRLGGTGLSGIGREGGTWSFDFYSDVKNTVYAGGRGG
jgi:acyl-CoA reductase-like NAD-dependent aldehyde dehydrogenase